MKILQDFERARIVKRQAESAKNSRLAMEYLAQDDLQRARDHQEISALWSYAARRDMGLND